MNSYKTYTVEEAKNRLERYCAYQERCHKEVREKLKELRMIPEAIDVIVNHLIEQGYLSETRFAQAFARGKFNNKHWGKNRIVRELKLRDISAINIKIALKEIPENAYLAAFDSLVEKRLKQLSTERSLPKKKKKLADYLLYRGWEPQLVWEKVYEIT
ncbi:MAG TPA: regulatory protein RecX [Flavobacteriaceae bacterium]|nr:RecX family transcriptional regulator [Flavobacteriaceae bacterium]MCB9212641.1 RecX family transcriptional regulator [Alteromonas sp.]HPF11498.1 regulatory protein RecX [Flavobacteriaceae bacterium]HQU21031.1 regulatory protein RecX [Flavobacteriaceae bacterium]HQU65932.1 regulatory protein RecX [Flavobacteriaceae bacterium]